VPLHPLATAVARTLNGGSPQRLAAVSILLRLLDERALELSEALSHAHRHRAEPSPRALHDAPEQL
jgi:hypothetical protein